MNVSALGPALACWPWILDSVGALRSAWAAQHPSASGPLHAPGLWAFSAAVLALPVYLVRTGRADDGTVPTEVAALFKVFQGLYMSAWRYWGGEGAIDADAFVDRLLARDDLHNDGRDRVCPGPTLRIRELVAAATAPAHGPADDGYRPALAYGGAYAALSLEKWLFDRSADERTASVIPVRDALAGWSSVPDSAEARVTELQRAICRFAGLDAPNGAFDPAWIRRRGSPSVPVAG